MAILKKLKQAVLQKKAVLLDLDNTLYAYAPCHREALKKTYQVYSRRIEKISFAQFQEHYNQARWEIHKRLHGQAASHSRLHYFQIMLEKKGSVSAAADFEEIYWAAFFKKMKLAAWVFPFLDFCAKEHKKVVIVTNLTTALQMRKLQSLKLDKKINFLVTSEEAGVEKPHPKIFRLALKKAGAKPGDAISVGDDIASDKTKSLAFFKI